MRWAGYRRVRGQVCKRIGRRLRALGLAELPAYRARLAADPGEWQALDGCLRVTISRFFRDRGVFSLLAERILPTAASTARQDGRTRVRLWVAGCASGEEPYSLSIAWRLGPAREVRDVRLAITATDAEPVVLARARAARYAAGSLRDVPPTWRPLAFEAADGSFKLRPPFREGVAFRLADVRREMPAGPFDLVSCRNLAFTYFDEATQRRILAGIARRLRRGGVLVIGAHEVLPSNPWFESVPGAGPVHRRRACRTPGAAPGQRE